MIKQNIKQAWRLLRETPILSGIAIFGTALSICMMMVTVMTFEVRNASLYPETKRDRMLYIKNASSKERKDVESNSTSNSMLAQEFADEVIRPMKTPEYVSVYYPSFGQTMVTLPGKNDKNLAQYRWVDDVFWKVFDFVFVDGAPFTEVDFKSGLKKVVIDIPTARKVFGRIDVTGEHLLLDYEDYAVCGVVKPVSTYAIDSYSQVWFPYDNNLIQKSWDGIVGNAQVAILAHKKSDFDAIRAEFDQRVKTFNSNPDRKRIAFFRGQPDTHFQHTIRKYANVEPDSSGTIRRMLIILLILMLVPAINLSAMTSSRMRKRMAELGVRKSFGATQGVLIRQVFTESMVHTLLGGVIGFLLAIAATYLLKGLLLSGTMADYFVGDNYIAFGTLFSFRTFFLALLFCFILNVFSTILPAWRASRKPIVESLLIK